MKKFGFLTLPFFLFPLLIAAQPYGNEWINYNQLYFKFPVAQPGVYRIDDIALSNAGVAVSGIDPHNIQVFVKGQEIPVYIQGESDGTFDPGDFIEFYAEGNDGFADVEFYNNASGQAHPDYSLFSDTIYYFITFNSSTSNKRILPETDVNFGAFTAIPHIWRESVSLFNTNYLEGKTYNGGGTDPAYEATEGWFDSPFSLGQTRARTVETSRAFTTGPQAQVHWKVIGASDYAQLVLDHHLNVTFAGITFDTIYEGYQVIEKHFNASPASLGASTTTFTFKSINDLGSGADRSAIAFLKVTYPHQLHFNNRTSFKFIVPDQSGQGKAYLPITNFVAAGPVRVYDLTNAKRIQVTSAGTNHQVLIPNAGGNKTCYIFSEPNIVSVTNIKPVSNTGFFRDFTLEESDSTFVIITHPKLRPDANQYSIYRKSKGLNTLLADVFELYDQYAYGIRNHPGAIRHFVDHISDYWADTPAYLFLIGKSIKTHQIRRDAANFGNNLVPSFGNPASDILLTAGLNGTMLDPLLATGRLSAKTPTEVSWYLQKVIEYEGNKSEPWMKNILHFAGGSNEFESNRFTGYLASFENILVDTSFGGKVYTFKKNTTAPIQTSLSDSITGLINKGTSILTFFGHASSTGGFDQNIDQPANYNNKGKYPLLVGNSCFTGDIHESQGQSTSEQFVLIRDRGVIAFLASVDLGFEDRLRDYSRFFFRSLGQVNYDGSLGQHCQYAIRQIQPSGNTYPVRSVTTLMTLHGDPAIIINSHELPDYAISAPDVSTTPDPITTQQDTFELHLHLSNFGKAINDSIRIDIARVFPDLSQDRYVVSSAAIFYEHDVTVKIPVDRERGIGFNRFDITIDPSNLILELSESNNFVSVNLFIKSGDIIPVIPTEFALVPDQDITLKASTGYAFETIQQYELQLDTNGDFNFPIETTKVTLKGGVIQWHPKALENMNDSAVFFWRARNTDPNSNAIWRSSSFQFIPGKTGWSQDHFHQYRRDNRLFIEMNEANRRFEFSPSVRKLTCQTSSTLNFSDLGDVLYKLDADLQEYGGCGISPAIHLAILDSLSFEPWGTPFNGLNASNNFGQVNINGNCGKPRVQNFFIFIANAPAQLSGLKDMLTTKVPDGNYILAWTWVRNDFSKWDAIDPTLRQVFTNLGADSIQSITNDSIPYIFFVKKGSPNTAIEVIGTKYNEFIYLSTNLMNNSTYGHLTSTIIGPAAQWDSVRLKHFSLDDPTSDTMNLSITGYTSQAAPTVLLDNIPGSVGKISLDGSIDAQAHPYIQLERFIQDDVLQTAAQPDYWMAFYKGVPEFALNAAELYTFHRDTLQEGEMIDFKVAVRNISDWDADSLLVRYYILDRNRNVVAIPDQRHKALMADSGLISELNYSSLGLIGSNTLVIEVNPDFDQPEQYHFNNVGQIPFYVKGDNENPVLDVTFDGVHILNGDIVSSKPEITIRLTDENPYLILDDTADFQVYLTVVGGQERRLYFQNNDARYAMDFIPASGKKNKAAVVLRPELLYDGVYGLRVRANDRTKNESGNADYQITFEVVNKSTITHMMNYPNPFSTSTRFVFTLTGSRSPDQLLIKVMTVSGKIVKNIDLTEFGQIRVGRNISEYAWDGRDEYGDKLANGVYLYTVEVRMDGMEVEHRFTEADHFFKHNVGKMVILR